MAQCGACTVHLNNEAIRSCVKRVADAAGKEITANYAKPRFSFESRLWFANGRLMNCRNGILPYNKLPAKMDYLTVYMASRASKSMVANQLVRKRALAERGNIQAMYDLALAYKSGEGVNKDAEQFFAWMRRAALADHQDGMLDVAWAYEEGTSRFVEVRLYDIGCVRI